MSGFDDTSALPKLKAIRANDQVVFSDNSVLYSKSRAVYAALAAQGYTHSFRVDYDHPLLSASTTIDAEITIPLVNIPANSFLEKARSVIPSPFKIGTNDTSEINMGLDSFEGTPGANRLTHNTGRINVRQTSSGSAVYQGDFIRSDDIFEITFTPPTGESLSSLDTGTVIVLLSLTNSNDYLDIVLKTL